MQWGTFYHVARVYLLGRLHWFCKLLQASERAEALIDRVRVLKRVVSRADCTEQIAHILERVKEERGICCQCHDAARVVEVEARRARSREKRPFSEKFEDEKVCGGDRIDAFTSGLPR
jgi:hypothetical protein